MPARPSPSPDSRRHRLQLLVALAIIGATAFYLASSRREQLPPVASLAVPAGHNIYVEVATTSERRARRLSGRSQIGADGLLLVWPDAGEHPIWMADMQFALDLVWVDANRRVLAVMSDVPPCFGSPCPLLRPALANRSVAVLELPSGHAACYLIAVGSTLGPTRPDSVDTSASSH